MTEKEVQMVMVMVQTVDPGWSPSEGGKKANLRAETKNTQQVSGKLTWHLCNLYVQINYTSSTNKIIV